MFDQSGGAAQLAPVLIALAVVVPILLLRNSRPRTLKVERLWLRPLLYILILGVPVIQQPIDLSPLVIALFVVAAAIGGLLGWLRGRMIQIEVHPETHAMTTRVSAAGIVFILALFGVRYVLRDAAYANILGLGLSYAAVMDALALLTIAIFVAQAVEMTLRANRLLAEARAAKAAASPASIG